MSSLDIAAFSPPEIPSKWDVIPIHNSDRGSFKRCRRYWNWNSPARQNLTLRADVYGISVPLWFGTGIHWALEQYYQPGLRHDPVEAWKTWYDVQWRGGLVTEEWLDRVYDLKPHPFRQTTVPAPEDIPTWMVRGLEDILPDPDHAEFEELYELGINMMLFYKEWSEKNDDFTVLMVEHDFSVPIWDYENHQILKMRDLREDSPNYGKILEVHARGRNDAVVYRESTGKISIGDYKTAAKIGDEYFEKLESDEQITSYLWAAQIEAQYYDLPYKGQPLEEVIYTVLRKAYPKPPTVLKNGMFSVDRENESCSYEMLQNFIASNLPGVSLTEKQQNYLDWLKDLGDEQFIIRKYGRRNQHELSNAGKRIYLESLDMLSPHIRIYPNITNDFKCLHCQFRVPCLAQEDGSDWQQIISDNYTVNKDR